MSETTDKINKLAIQHKAIGAKTDCPHFSTIGNLCSRVQNGMMRCDEYLECEFKYIDALKEENEKLKKYIKDLQIRKDRYYLQVLEYEKQINDWISFYIKVRDIISGNYEILESQGLQELRRIISEVTND